MIACDQMSVALLPPFTNSDLAVGQRGLFAIPILSQLLWPSNGSTTNFFPINVFASPWRQRLYAMQEIVLWKFSPLEAQIGLRFSAYLWGRVFGRHRDVDG
jgi:hypothetical protein